MMGPRSSSIRCSHLLISHLLISGSAHLPICSPPHLFIFHLFISPSARLPTCSPPHPRIQVLEEMVKLPKKSDPTPQSIVWEFLYKAVVGSLWGVFLGVIAVTWLSTIFNQSIIEITITVAFAYMAFFSAEALGMSGVLAVVALGLYMGKVGRTRISPEVGHFLQEFWEMLAFAGNTVIFVIAGLVITFKLNFTHFSGFDVGVLLLIYVCATITRGFIVAMVYMTVQLGTGKLMDWRDGVVATWGGLRGAVGLALAMMVFASDEICENIREKVMVHLPIHSPVPSQLPSDVSLHHRYALPSHCCYITARRRTPLPHLPFHTYRCTLTVTSLREGHVPHVGHRTADGDRQLRHDAQGHLPARHRPGGRVTYVTGDACRVSTVPYTRIVASTATSTVAAALGPRQHCTRRTQSNRPMPPTTGERREARHTIQGLATPLQGSAPPRETAQEEQALRRRRVERGGALLLPSRHDARALPPPQLWANR